MAKNYRMSLDSYDYGQRNHNAGLGRWHCIDRKVKAYYSLSPYHYAGNATLSSSKYNIATGSFNATTHPQIGTIINWSIKIQKNFKVQEMQQDMLLELIMLLITKNKK